MFAPQNTDLAAVFSSASPRKSKKQEKHNVLTAMTIRPDVAIARYSERASAALGQALNRAIRPVAQYRRLTAPPNRAQHTEITVVFDYSKVKERLPTPVTGRSSWPKGMSQCHHKRALFLAKMGAWSAPLAELGRGRISNGKDEMQSSPHAQASSRGPAHRCRLLRAPAILTFALLISAAFAHSGWAQGTVPPTMAQPLAPTAAAAPAIPASPNVAAPVVTAPNAGTPGAALAPLAPATNSAVPGRQVSPNSTPNSEVAAPAPGEPSVGGELLPQKLSLVGMYLDADRVVKAVMIGLAFASLVTWTVFFAKTWELYTARMEVRQGLRILADVATLAQAHEQLRNETTPAAQLMQAAAHEIRLSSGVRGDGLKERIAWRLERLEMAASRKISRGTGVLATIGATAPFVGLFGTVWGIMNSFIGISNAHTTNLAVVAPGIAQALLATAMGLVAAIPAVMIYNVLARQTTHYRALLGDASAQVMGLVSRDLDRAKLPLAQAAE